LLYRLSYRTVYSRSCRGSSFGAAKIRVSAIYLLITCEIFCKAYPGAAETQEQKS
jgi:hypothetical protein